MELISTILLSAAKLIIALLMFVLGLIFIFITIKANEWRLDLASIENTCDEARDMTVLQATVTRAQLADLREKLKNKEEKAKVEIIGSLMKNALPVVTLLANREKNLWRWGISGIKFVKSCIDYMKTKGQG